MLSVGGLYIAGLFMLLLGSDSTSIYASVWYRNRNKGVQRRRRITDADPVAYFILSSFLYLESK